MKRRAQETGLWQRVTDSGRRGFATLRSTGVAHLVQHVARDLPEALVQRLGHTAARRGEIQPPSDVRGPCRGAIDPTHLCQSSADEERVQDGFVVVVVVCRDTVPGAG